MATEFMEEIKKSGFIDRLYAEPARHRNGLTTRLADVA
jgi:hypothetical protein